MKTRHKLSVITAFIIAVSGCAKKSNLDTVTQDRKIFDQHVSECNYENGLPDAPKWICGYPIDEKYPITDVRFTNLTLQTVENKASPGCWITWASVSPKEADLILARRWTRDAYEFS